MVEFLLMAPIYLLLIGGSLLLADLLMGKLYVLEGNRNLSWGGTEVLAEQKDRLVQGAVKFHFEYGNSLSRRFGDGTPKSHIWSYTPSDAKAPENEWVGEVSAVRVDSGQGNDRQNGYFRADTNWGMLLASNMGVRMTRLSPLYIGAVETSRVAGAAQSEGTLTGAYSLRRAENLFSPDGPQTFDSCLYFRNPPDLEPSVSYESFVGADDTACLQWPLYINRIFSVAGEAWPRYEDGDKTKPGDSGPDSGSGTAPEGSEDVEQPRYKRVYADFAQ